MAPSANDCLRFATAVGLVATMGDAALAQDVERSVAEFAAQLEREREQGVLCAGVVKGYGTASDQLAARFEYTKARGAFNAAIEEMSVSLIATEAPPDEETRLGEGAAGIAALCDRARKALPDLAGTKSPLLALLASLSGEIAKAIGAVGTVWVGLNKLEFERRKELAARLDAKRWPAYDDVAPVH